jgi:hypothetical protein
VVASRWAAEVGTAVGTAVVVVGIVADTVVAVSTAAGTVVAARVDGFERIFFPDSFVYSLRVITQLTAHLSLPLF